MSHISQFFIIRLSRRNLVIGALTLCIMAIIAPRFITLLQESSGLSCVIYTEDVTDNYAVTQLSVQGNSYTVLVADSPEKWQRGLMEVKGNDDICGHDGMVFEFPIAMPQTFWNKNTRVDLDIFWMKGEQTIGQGSLPAVTQSGIITISSPMAVDRVVEIIR